MSNNSGAIAPQKWSKTVDDKEMDVFNPDPSLFSVDRIAYVLARINRFAGHWVFPVSVARHSLEVAKRLRRGGYDVETQLQGLFHDASEAFTTDIPSPLKRLLYVLPGDKPYHGGDSFVGYHEFEEGLLRRIFAALEIEYPLRPEVHTADKRLTEQESSWIRHGASKRSLYRGLSIDPNVVTLAFQQRARGLFEERACNGNAPNGPGV